MLKDCKAVSIVLISTIHTYSHIFTGEFIVHSNPPANLSCYLQEMVNTIRPVAQKRRSGKMSLLLSEEVSKTTSDVDHTCLWHDNTRHLMHHPSPDSLQKTLGSTHWSDMSSIPEWASNMRSSGIKPESRGFMLSISMYAYARTKYTKCNRVSSTGQRKPSWWFSSPYLHLNAPKFMESHFQRHSNADTKAMLMPMPWCHPSLSWNSTWRTPKTRRSHWYSKLRLRPSRSLLGACSQGKHRHR